MANALSFRAKALYLQRKFKCLLQKYNFYSKQQNFKLKFL